MKLVLFGEGPYASLCWYALAHDAAEEIAGFVVDAAFRTRDELHGLPVIDYERMETSFPSDAHRLLLTIGPHDMNALRKSRFDAAKARGYRFARYISSKAITWPDLALGENSMIFEGAVVQPFASIGSDTIIRSGVHIGHHVEIGDHAFVATGACFGGGGKVGERCFIGLNATIRDNVSIADGCCIAAGAVVTRDTEPDGLYVGVPARRAPRLASAGLRL